MSRLPKRSLIITVIFLSLILFLMGISCVLNKPNNSLLSSNLEDVVSVKKLGAIGNGKTNDSAAIQSAIDQLNQRGGGVLYFPKGTYIISSPIVVNNNIRIKGSGKYSSILKIKGNIKAIDLSSKHAKVGVVVESLGIVGTGEKGQIGIDAYYFVNGSYIQDIRIEDVEIGMRLAKVWHASFKDLFIKGCTDYGIHVKSLSSEEQVNGIRFSSVFIQKSKNAVFLDGQNPSMGIHFDSSTFEQSKETAIISKGFSPLLFTNCYFEANYQDAKKKDKLTWVKPIDVQIQDAKTKTLVKFESCYFSRATDFLPSSEKVGIYLGENTSVTVTNSSFVTGTSNYLEADIFSNSKYETDISNISQDGHAKQNIVNKKTLE